KTPQPGTNPLDKYGRRSKCAVCQSTYHWAKDCPHKDTACTRTVCGQEWLDNYSTVLQKKSVKMMKETEAESHRPFKFGDGKVVYSGKRVKIPAKIGNMKCNIETEVVPINIPLLLSKTSLKRAGTVLDMEIDSAVMFNQPVKLDFTSSGHYCVNIVDNDNKNPAHSDQILTVEDKLLRLMNNSGNKDAECPSLLQKIINQCEVCQKYCKTKPKPAVGLPLASTYNETVAIDLHNFSLVYALKSTKFVAEKRLRLEISSIKELIQTKRVGQVLWSETKDQLADCLTKKGASSTSLLRALYEGCWTVT
ncbi:hypothetical protein PO909_008715, partial [Leuciscus waleckii]